MSNPFGSSTVRASVLARLVVAAAILWHVLAVFGPPKQPPPPNTEGRDFASYYYAERVASLGGNPYDKPALESVAAEDGTRAEVHPFFYPPPFLWLVVWVGSLPLSTAFWLWFVIGELSLLASCMALLWWWRPFGSVVAPILAVVVAVMYAVAYSAELGQANFQVLFLVLLGLGFERRSPIAAGALVGLAAMLKMAPALFVLWWLLRRQWVAAGAAVVTAIVVSVLTLPIVPLFTQLDFYTHVLPRFGSGDYNGLTIKIEMFGNHSLPNLWHQYLPSGANVLSPGARALSLVSTVGLLAGLAAAFRRQTDDPVRIAAQACAVLVAMLLIPVYTYEHHLVFAIPAIVLGCTAVARGWLSLPWVVVLAFAVPVMLFDLPALRQLDLRVVTAQSPALYFWIQELKTVALLAVGATMVRLGATTRADLSRAPAPTPAAAVGA